MNNHAKFCFSSSPNMSILIHNHTSKFDKVSIRRRHWTARPGRQLIESSKLESFCLAWTKVINSEVKGAIKTCLECRNRITTYLMPWTNIQYKCYKQGDPPSIYKYQYIVTRSVHPASAPPDNEILVLLLLPSSTPCIKNPLVLKEVSK